jgi:predicted membrane protein
MNDLYETKTTTAQWWACDLPGNAGWIIWLICTWKCLAQGITVFSVLALLPAFLMIIGIIEIISERIAKLDRVLPKKRVIRGFGALTLGGIVGIPVALIGIIQNVNGSLPFWMLAGAVLCGLFAGLLYKGYRKKESM